MHNTGMRIYLKYLPLVLWFLNVAISFASDLDMTKKRLETLNLVGEYMVGGLSVIYYPAAFVAFFDDILLLIVALILYRFFSKKYNVSLEKANKN